MKFKIDRALLDSTLNYVSKGLSTKTPMPVLTGIYINVEKDSITFIATNKEISTKVVLALNERLTIIDPGDVVAPGKYLVDIVKKIDDGEIEISAYDDSNIKIISSNSDFTLTPYNKNNYPRVNFDIGNEVINISCKEFKTIVKKTAFACSLSEVRIVFTSVHFDINNDNLSATSTDTYRLSNYSTKIDDISNTVRLNVPAHSLEELTKILPDTDEMLSCSITSNVILFRFNNVFFMSRLIEDSYPDITHLFALNPISSIKVDKIALIQALDRASLFTSFDSSLCIKLHFKDDYLEVASASSEVGKVVVKIDVLEKTSDEEFTISFVAKNLIEAAKAFDSETVQFDYVSDVKPAKITSESEPELKQVLLPIRNY